MYIHIPKEKRANLDPSRRKGIFVGYSDTSNSYQIYFLGSKKIDDNRDLSFDEDSTYFISRRKLIQEDKEPKDTRAWGMEIGEAIPKDHEYHDMEEP